MCAGTETDTGRNQSAGVGIWIHITVMSELTSCEWGKIKRIIKKIGVTATCWSCEEMCSRKS